MRCTNYDHHRHRGAGFIGSNFIFHMLEAHPEYRIICLDKLTYAGNLSTLKSVMVYISS